MSPAGWIPERSEIIYIQHSPHAGDEMPGIHPLLVVSTKQFNEKTGIVIGFPMTHAERHKTTFRGRCQRSKRRSRLRCHESAEVIRLESARRNAASVGRRAWGGVDARAGNF